MTTAVIDPMLLAQGLLCSSGAARQLVDTIRLKRFRAVTSNELIGTVLAVLGHNFIRKSYQLDHEALIQVGIILYEMMWVQDAAGDVQVARHDTVANALAAAAVASRAQCIITDNVALQSLGVVRGITIVEPQSFLDSMKRTELPD